MANTDKPKGREELAKMMSPNNPVECILEPSPAAIVEGGVVVLRATVMNIPAGVTNFRYDWSAKAGHMTVPDSTKPNEAHWDTTGLRPSSYEATVEIYQTSPSPTAGESGLLASGTTSVTVIPRQVQASVTLQRSAAASTKDQAL